MDFPTVQNSVNDVPATFKRQTQSFLQWADSESAALARGTIAADSILAMVVSILDAKYGWLDFWGLLFGLPRNASESDSTYLARVQYTISNGAGPLLAIQNWIEQIWGVAAVVTDSAGVLGYSITFPPVVTLAQVQQIIDGLNRVRPAGVPFMEFLQNTGTYLDTVNFLDCARISSAYLGGEGVTRVYPFVSAGTPNTTAKLPTLFMTDPTLNPATP